ncbi:MAG: hypothetical protein R3E10_11425 [Gemmatimonadota bacterium]
MRTDRTVLALGTASLLAAFAFGVAIGRFSAGPHKVTKVVVVDQNSIFADLDLTAEQQQRIDGVLAELAEWTDSLAAESEGVLEERTARTQAAILEVLTPEQRERYRSRIDSARVIMRVRREAVGLPPSEP